MRNYWLDGIMGVAVGDALGLPVQFMSREELVLDPVTGMRPCDLYLSPIGTWSDDTAMTMAIYESIKRLGTVDADDIMRNFVKWMYEDEFSANDECIDEGNTCHYGIKNYKDGADIYTCGKAGLYYGYDAIPSEWLEVLRKREWLEANAFNGKGLE